MIAYLDTSAMVKLVLDDEVDAGVALEIWRAVDGAVASRLVHVEGRAALASAERARRLTAARHDTAREDLEVVLGQLEMIELAPGVAGLAGDLAQQMALKAGDAVHLASALTVSVSDDLLFVTWDRRLAMAATSAGLAVAPA